MNVQVNYSLPLIIYTTGRAECYHVPETAVFEVAAPHRAKLNSFVRPATIVLSLTRKSQELGSSSSA